MDKRAIQFEYVELSSLPFASQSMPLLFVFKGILVQSSPYAKEAVGRRRVIRLNVFNRSGTPALKRAQNAGLTPRFTPVFWPEFNGSVAVRITRFMMRTGTCVVPVERRAERTL
jgi:hypothetical protein